MHPLEKYANELRSVSTVGVKETSYYPALGALFTDIGKTLKPNVRCVTHPRSQGAGLPDIGLYTADQLRGRDSDPLANLPPGRGVVEAKGAGDNIDAIANSEQVGRYLKRYGLVLVTNLRQFRLMGRDSNGAAIELESYSLADSASTFGDALKHPQQLVQQHGVQFIEYLKRVLLRGAPLTAPRDLAWYLASYARDAKARIENEGAGIPALDKIRTALEDSLGFHFDGAKGEHFFYSTLVQTLFYGIFSAWVLWSKRQPQQNIESFRWREASWELRVPVLEALFSEIAKSANLRALGLVDILNRTGETLNRVDRAIFFQNFEESHAIQYFYEPFLEAFDPQLRKDLGVWYTPAEIVQYMVARVDTVLREEMGIADGLANDNVYVLDPACGTGAYLVEVLRHIEATLQAKGEGALLADKVKQTAMKRVFGFEILPAPFVVAHLQLGLLLQSLGAPFTENKGAAERAGVYLTNSLTGWHDVPIGEPTQLELDFPELSDERDAAEEVKLNKPILVVLGNPPYNAFAGVSAAAEEESVEIYKQGLIKDWGIKKFNLDDLYVRFFRLAERRITEKTGKGVVCYISNFSYLSDASYVVMRQRLLAEFDQLWFDSLNGDSRETGKLTPEGKPDPSIFSTAFNKEGIRVGTAIGLMVRQPQRRAEPVVRYREFWGVNKRAELVESLTATDLDSTYSLVQPLRTNRFSFRLSNVENAYLTWPKIVELCAEEPISGLQEMRHGTLMAIDRAELERRMAIYFDRNTDWNRLVELGAGPTENGGRFHASASRAKLLTSQSFDKENIVRYALYPFDQRWSYYTTARPLWNEPRPALAAQNWKGNTFILTRMVAERPNENAVILSTAALPDYHLLRPNAVAIPIRLRPQIGQIGNNVAKQGDIFGDGLETRANLSPNARRYLQSIGITNPDADEESAALIWMHALAIGYAPSYLGENKDGVRQDWPRIPLPASAEALRTSAEFGRRIAALLDSETPVAGVTAGAIRPELRTIGMLTRVGGGSLNSGTGDLAVTVGWGHGGAGKPTMPGTGQAVEREYVPAEQNALAAAATRLSLTADDVARLLGTTTSDIYLNKIAYWRNIPARVWDYTIGGYQVIKKWLSYREQPILGRPLTGAEVDEVTNMARRIGAILLMEPELDTNYAQVKRDTYSWG